MSSAVAFGVIAAGLGFGGTLKSMQHVTSTMADAWRF